MCFAGIPSTICAAVCPCFIGSIYNNERSFCVKKIALILVAAMLFASFALLSVGANTTDPGEVAYQHTTYTWVISYTYADDATAVANGAIAKFTNVNDQKTNYLKSWRTIGAFASDSGKGCGDTITLISDSSNKITITADNSFDVGGRSLILEGNGITVESAKRLDILGNDTSSVTLKNMKISGVATDGTGAMQVGADTKGPKVILDNTVIETQNAPKYAVFVNKSSDLILTNGSKIKTDAVPAEGLSAGGLLGMGTSATIEVNDGTSVVAGGYAINLSSGTASVTVKGGEVKATGTGSDAIKGSGKITVNGGIVEAASGRAIYAYGEMSEGIVTASSTTVINGGIVRSGGGYATLHCDCESTITVNGGLITTVSDTTKLSLGLAMVGSKSKMGGKLIINDGTFYYKNATKSAPMLKAHESSDLTHEVVINGGDFVGSGYIFNGNYNVEDTEAVNVKNPFVYNGAAIRTATDSSGLRFRSLITKEAIDAADALKKNGTSVKYGTLIVPTDYLEATGGIFTRSALKAAKKSFSDIPAVNGIETQSNGDVIISAAIVNMYEENFERAFSAVAYISYETENGTVTVYSSYNKEKNSRSAAEVAIAALADVATESAGYYTTAVTEWYALEGENYVLKTGNAFSPYSEAQLAVIKSYISNDGGAA